MVWSLGWWSWAIEEMQGGVLVWDGRGGFARVVTWMRWGFLGFAF